MAGKLAAALGVGLALGVLLISVGVGRTEAQGQVKGQAPWEYKVVYSTNQVKDTEKAMTEQFNALAAEGWEYVGPVMERSTTQAGPVPTTAVAGANVLFKRTKR